MRVFLTAVIAGSLWLVLSSSAFADVQVSLHDGRVSIVAKDATVRQILTEWARVGHTKIVNVERIPGGPITLELKDVPETEALDVLLRTLSGYMASPRSAAATADASQFDAIIVMPTTAPPPSRNAGGAGAPFTPPPSGFPVIDDDPPGQQPPQRGPIFSTFPQPQVATPPQQRPNLPPVRPGIAPPPDQGQQPVQPPVVFPQPAAPNAQQPSPAPFGAVSTPGMIAQPAQQPGQVGQPRRNDN